jgi:hypothetical protein
MPPTGRRRPRIDRTGGYYRQIGVRSTRERCSTTGAATDKARVTDTAPIAVLADLTDRERELVDVARHGTVLVCSDLPVDDLADSDDPARCVRAELVRELLLGRRGELDPRGIRLGGARIVGGLDLDYVRGVTGLRLAGCAVVETIIARGAHLPWLSLFRSRINTLVADGLQVDGSMRLGGVRVTGSGEYGVIRLHSAHIGGPLDLQDAEIVNDTGPALIADGLQVDGSLILKGVRATGSGERGTIRLHRAHIGGQLDLEGGKLVSNGGQTLNLQGAQVEGSVFLPASLVCPEPTRTPPCPHPDRVVVNRFTFGTISRVDWQDWLHLIRCHTPDYRPSPYQQLAGVERAAGHDGNARRILIAQQQDIYRRTPEALGGWWTQRFHWFWGALAGYGYRTRYTAIALFLALAASGLLGYGAGQIDTRPGHHAAERTLASGSLPGTACSSVELIGLGLDRGLPLGPTGLRTRCDLDTATRWGQTFTIAIWIIQAAVWGLATLALAGYTGLIRKAS